MAIKRFFASRDNTITNAFNASLTDTNRATGSNMGAADVLETFSIYGQGSGSSGLSQELSRILIQFPIDEVSTARTAGTIPASGSVNFYLKMFNARHAFTIPLRMTLQVLPVSQSWQEGVGLDMDEYVDKTYGNSGSNWVARGQGLGDWKYIGGTYLTGSAAYTEFNYNVSFDPGYDDLSVDITGLVEQWIKGSGAGGGFDNNGVGLHLIPSQEAYYSSSAYPDLGNLIQNVDGATDSYYTKKFFSRSSEYFFKRPALEARWDSAVKDNRGSFYYSSSLAPPADNFNTLYLYNYVRGRLVDVPDASGVDPLTVRMYSSSAGLPTGSGLLLVDKSTSRRTTAAAGRVSTGIYSASFALTAAATPLTAVHDVWELGSLGNPELFTGSFFPELMPTYNNAPTFERVININNLKPKYSRRETARFRTFVRSKNYNPNIYTVATSDIPNESIVSASYKVIRLTDNLEVIPYGTGSSRCTYLSYDVSGNYFDLDMSMLETDYSYGIKLSFYNDSIGSWVEQPYTFRFRVEDDT